MSSKNPHSSPASTASTASSTTIASLFSPIQSAADITLDTVYQNISASSWKQLFTQARQAGLEEFIADFQSGKPVNQSEKRPALHFALRNLSKTPVLIQDQDIMPPIAKVWQRIEALCNQWVGVTDVIHIGIGGSDFGPRLAVQALSYVPHINSRGMRMHFLANIDSAGLAHILECAQPNSTRVIVVSKSFTTLETTLNAKAVVDWLKAHNHTQTQIAQALFAVTANVPAAEQFGVAADNIFPFWEWVGGRYSVWSAVGLPIALQYGFDTYQEFLAGAHAIDQHFFTAPLEQNLPVIMALALFYQQEKHHIQSIAVIPYADALEDFPKWLQQLDMESNGKRIGRHGQLLKYSCPVVFGSAGSNAQHSYFQLLHQGLDIIPIDFIAVREPMSKLPEAQTHHRQLLANCLAQAQALANGKTSDNPNEDYPGKRPSNFLLLPKLNAFYLGALMALYEHRTVALGALWDINSFDQPGVELGKVLAKPIEQALLTSSEPNLISADATIDAVTAARIALLKK